MERRTRGRGMTNRDYWLKLFSENDVALASAIILCERFVTDEQLTNKKEYITKQISKLNEEVSNDVIKEVFS
jgi:hypothetical protein